MSENRKRCLQSLQNTGLEIVLVTPENLNSFLIEPLHEGYVYLSETHKADYLRTYFMHFYGGGYSDIKTTKHSWLPYVEMLEKSQDKWIIGYREIKSGTNVKQLQDKYMDLIGNCAYISKPYTPLTLEWYCKMMYIMDLKLEELKKYPSKYAQQSYEDDYHYPLKWAELLCDIYHPIIYKYKDHVFYDLPSPCFNAYS